VVLASGVHFAGQLGQFIARRAHSCTHMFECIVNSSTPFITITTIITIIIIIIVIILIIIIICTIIDVFGTCC
jgi:type I restriction-modification system DNA methylase subunit